MESWQVSPGHARTDSRPAASILRYALIRKSGVRLPAQADGQQLSTPRRRSQAQHYALMQAPCRMCAFSQPSAGVLTRRSGARLPAQADGQRIPAARGKVRHEVLAPAPRRVEGAVHKQQRRPRGSGRLRWPGIQISGPGQRLFAIYQVAVPCESALQWVLALLVKAATVQSKDERQVGQKLARRKFAVRARGRLPGSRCPSHAASTSAAAHRAR